ncbi:ROK family protein [Nocardioides KLBMP 9356]|uniref:ROK family protein n=1 Tax=Nocardioides potassii TaxID=2911371 RepID=A0ABS9HAC4_9ACTN|nr:ROK family protein [Nocardioides potassii]
MDLIRRGKAETTTELAHAMGLARSTVSERIEALQRLDLLVPAGETTPSRGRPAGRFSFNAKAGVTLAAQVGMSGTMVAITDLAGEVEWHDQVQHDIGAGPEALYDLLLKQFNNGLRDLGRETSAVLGIGVGLPGDIEIASAPARAAGSAGSWDEQALRDRLSETFGALAIVDRDVNLMAIGEHRSSWPDAKVFMCLKVGTVIACGLVIDDQVIRGASGMLGEVGHTKLAGADLPCACGSRGCLNTVAGGPALAAHLSEMGLDAHSARDVSNLANNGNIPAGQAVRVAGQRIGEVVASAINLLNPDVITVWGYLVDSGDQFLAGLQESVYKTALPSSAQAAIITRARLGDDVGLRGAALTVIERALEPEKIDLLVDAVSA